MIDPVVNTLRWAFLSMTDSEIAIEIIKYCDELDHLFSGGGKNHGFVPDINWLLGILFVCLVNQGPRYNP